MTNDRRRRTIAALALLTIIAGGGGALLEIRQNQSRANWASLLPQVPDLQRWPVELQEKLSRANERAIRRGGPIGDLAELAELYLANHYNAEAEKVLGVLVQRDPSNAHWPYLLGISRRNEGNADEAERLFRSTLKIDPDYAPAWLQLGQVLGSAKKLADARGCFEARLRLMPADPQSEYELAKIEFAEVQSDQAIARLRRVVVSDPSIQEAHLMLADMLERRGERKAADEQRAFIRGGRPSPPTRDPWLEAIYLKSSDTYLVQAYGALLMEGGKTEAAIPFLRRAADLEPSDAEVVGSLAKAYDDLNRHEEAQKVLSDALKKAPKSEILSVRLAQSEMRAGKSEAALATVENALKQVPANALLLSAKGEILLGLHRPREALETLEKALQQDPTMVGAQLNMGRSRLALDDRRGAEIAGKHAVQMRPDDKDALGFLASLQMEMRDWESAEQNAEKLFQLDPQRREAIALLAQVKLQRGNVAAEANRLEQAEKAYREGLLVDSSNGQLHGALGMLLGKERRYADAVIELKEFLNRAPADPLAYLLLASAQANAGNLGQARDTVRKGLSVARETKNSSRTQQLESLARQLGE